MRSWKKINICEVLVVVLILRDHLLQKEDKDWRETAAFQEEPTRTAFPPDSRLVRRIYLSAVTVPPDYNTERTHKQKQKSQTGSGMCATAQQF